MCLAVPGRIEGIEGEDPASRTARVSFAGVEQSVSLAFLPDAEVGDWVLVHVGFALSRIDDAEARRVFDLLGEIESEAETGDRP